MHLFRLGLVIMLLSTILLPAAAMPAAPAPPMGEVLSDLGDAPDSLRTGGSFEAYPGVLGTFPTETSAAQAGGPIHTNTTGFVLLGASASAEAQAASGYDGDTDGTNNLIVAQASANNDGYDDGLRLPARMEHCALVELTVTISVTALSTPHPNAYLNLWADWDRNGAWGQMTPACPGQSVGSSEWIVANMQIPITDTGVLVVTTPAFRVWHPDAMAEVWFRASLAEAPAPAADGSGPASGYLFGETEDYLWRPAPPFQTFLPFITRPEPAVLPDHDHHVDVIEPQDVLASWPQLPAAADASTTIMSDALALVITSNTDETRILTATFSMLVNGERIVLEQPLGEVTRITRIITYTGYIPEIAAQIPDATRSPGLIYAEIVVGDEHGPRYTIAPERLQFHTHSSVPGQWVIYREEGFRRQLRALSFDGNPALGAVIASNLPQDVDPQTLDELVMYEDGDGILTETPIEGQDELPEPQLHGNTSYTVCAEWNVQVVDNGYGEDYGTADGGWRARGAKAKVYHGGTLVFDGRLNQSGCVVTNGPASNAIMLIMYGNASLNTTGGAITMHYLDDMDANYDAVAATFIFNPQPNGVYRPELSKWDAFGVLSYVIRERINGGVGGKEFYLVKGDCKGTDAGGGCATSHNGKRFIFLDSTVARNGWQRKYITAHEWGHLGLALGASYRNDCSFAGSGHSFYSEEYATCAAMEGWAHFAALVAWNNHVQNNNPDAVFVLWNSKGDSWTFDAEGGERAHCFETFLIVWTCGSFGFEVDWMRHWWDFYSNDLPANYGVRPTMPQLYSLVNSTDMNGTSGLFNLSQRFQTELSGAQRSRWIDTKCWNGIDATDCY